MRQAPSNILTLTPLRGVAAIFVALYHFNYTYIIDPPGGYLFLKKCYILVDLFFIMSGFIMMHVYENNFSNGITNHKFRKFIIARFARIYPLHLFMLLVYVAMVYLSGHSAKSNPIYAPSGIVSNILMLQSCGTNPTGTWNVPSWSISAEWWAYVLFPFICLFLFKKRALAIVTVVLGIILIYLSIMYYLPRTQYFNQADIDTSYDYGYLRGIAGFACGMLLYFLYQIKRLKKVFAKDIVSVILLVLVLVAMNFAILDIFYIPLFMLLILAFASNDQQLCKLSKNKFLQFTGDISYSFYLTHEILILLGIQVLQHTHFGYSGPFVHGMFNAIPILLIFLLITTLVSYLTYNFVEKPCRDFINYRFNQKKVATVPA